MKVRRSNSNMFVDVVDEKDTVIGTTQRNKVIPEGLNFRVVHLFLFNPKGELLLQKISSANIRSPHKWGSSVAGYLMQNEKYSDAIVRKTREELGFKLDHPNFLGKFVMHDENSLKHIALYTICYNSQLHPDSYSIEEIKFYPISELERMLLATPDQFTLTFRFIFREYLNYKHGN